MGHRHCVSLGHTVGQTGGWELQFLSVAQDKKIVID
jgi:hypothetical protein